MFGRLKVVPLACGLALVAGAWSDHALWRTTPASGQLLSDDILQQINAAIDLFRQGKYEQSLEKFRAGVEAAQSYVPTPADYLNQAADYSDAGDTVRALEAVDRALEAEPQNTSALVMRGMILVQRARRGDFDEAARMFQQALSIDAKHRIAARELFHLWRDQMRYNDMIRAFKLYLEQSPQDPYLLYYLGRAYQAAGDPTRAMQTLTEAVRTDPGDSQAQVALFEALVEGGGEAIQTFEQLVAEYPEPMLKLALAEIYVQRGQADKALPLLAELEQMEVTEVGVFRRRTIARILADAERYDDAIRVASRIAPAMKQESSRDYYELLRDLGQWQIAAGRPEEAIRQLFEALNTYRSFATDQPISVLFSLGEAFHKLGDMQQAEFYFRQYLDESRSRPDPETLELLGDIYLSERNYARAAEQYQQVLQVLGQYRSSPEMEAMTAQARLKLAGAYFLQGEQTPAMYDKCIAEVNDLANKPGMRGPASVLLARAYLRTNQPPQRAAGALRAIEHTDDWSDEADFVLGEALLADGQNEAALDYVRRACEAKPDDTARTLLLARVLTLLGKFDEAQQIYDEVLKTHRQSVAALAGLGELQVAMARELPLDERIPRLEQAVRHLAEARKLAQYDPEIRSKLGNAERELATAQAAVESRQQRYATMFWTAVSAVAVFCVALAIVVPVWWTLQRLRKERLLQRVLHLESQLAQVIRHEARRQLGEHWQETLAADKKLADRVSFRWLMERASETGKEDALAAANFGHLIAVLDEKWKTKGFAFAGRAKHDTLFTKHLVISNLNYISACRNAHLAHATSENAGGRSDEARHMDLQVNRSLQLVQENFDLSTSAVSSAALATADSSS